MKVALCIVAALLVGQACAEAYKAYDTKYDPAVAPKKVEDKVKEEKDSLMDKVKDLLHLGKKKTFKSGSVGSYGAGFSPMQCTGHAFCFTEKSEPVEVEPSCRTGYKWDKMAKKCYKLTGFQCGDMATPCKDDKTKCYVCKIGEFVNKDNKCEKLCKAGYRSVDIEGSNYCVEDCKEGYTPMGQDCVKFEDAKSPKECSAKKCGLGKKLYFVSKTGSPYADEDSYASSSYGAAYMAADKVYADSYAKDPKKDDAECVCAKTKKRDVYAKAKCTDPKIEDATRMYDWCDATCGSSSIKPDALGKCPKVCPSNCVMTADGKCETKCPAGYKVCKGKKGSFCATKYELFGCDSCEFLEKMYKDLDKDAKCGAKSTPKH